MTRIIWYCWVVVIAFSSCKKDNVSNEAGEYTLLLPTHFPSPVYDLNKNKITKSGFELGRRLFYDPALSRDGKISCGSCHQQFAGFAHSDHDVSHGVDDLLGNRNSLAVINMLWNQSFFWDGGVFNMDLLTLNPITNPVEMDNTMPKIIETLQKDPTYVAQFQRAFPDNGVINQVNVFKAFSQFMSTLISANSPYDAYVLGDKSALMPLEIQGLNLFENNCSTCHQPPLFTDQSFRSNGLPGNSDLGRYNATLIESDKYKFKVPTLRNIEVTGPYMHTGKFKTLESIVEHYSSKVEDNSYTDPLLYKNGKAGFQFTSDEKAALVAFLKSLTDKQFLTNPLFSEQ
jgi:cytochrome c peroxidase